MLRNGTSPKLLVEKPNFTVLLLTLRIRLISFPFTCAEVVSPPSPEFLDALSLLLLTLTELLTRTMDLADSLSSDACRPLPLTSTLRLPETMALASSSSDA